MAKFGEGDPRWLVQDRADGTNVNNWHWVEKDAMDWSRTRLQEVYSNLVLLDGSNGLSLRIEGVDKISGEAIINNRKNKIIPSYELEIALKWSGEAKDGDGNTVASAQGRVHLPYVADENHDEEPELRFASETDSNVSTQLKSAFLTKCKKPFLEVLNKFISELRAGGPALSSKGQDGSQPSAAAAAAAAAAGAATSAKVKLSSAPPEELHAAAPSTSTSAAGAKKARSSLNLSERFYANPQDIFECFTVEGRVKAFTQSNAVIDARPGGKFSWFNGSVQGEFVELEPGKKIVMNWRFNTWQDDCSSKVVISLEAPEPGTTILRLQQTGIPEADKFGNEDVLDTTDKGWRGQVLLRIRQVFGYGV